MLHIWIQTLHGDSLHTLLFLYHLFALLIFIVSCVWKVVEYCFKKFWHVYSISNEKAVQFHLSFTEYKYLCFKLSLKGLFIVWNVLNISNTGRFAERAMGYSFRHVSAAKPLWYLKKLFEKLVRFHKLETGNCWKINQRQMFYSVFIKNVMKILTGKM